MRRLWDDMSRRKPPSPSLGLGLGQGQDGGGAAADTNMKHVLTLWDLTLLGVGATLGIGVYILAGQTAFQLAGPAVVVSFLIAAFASMLAALCYAELASVVPTAGTAYTYSYVGIGEFPAFFVGWNLLLEYAIATASVARAFANYVDAVTGNKIRSWSLQHVPLECTFLAEFPGLLAFSFVTLLAVLLALGVRESSLFNNVCTFFNLVTIGVTVVAGSYAAKSANWSIRREDIPPSVPDKHAGRGGFLPFGVGGVLAGAAKCFFGYVGFDTITSCGEEAKNPRRNIPLSIMLTLIVIVFTYVAVSVVGTMMVPYYEQDVNTPFPSAFQKVGLTNIKWIVTFGAIFAMCTSLVGSMFPLPRVLLTMAADGMIFRSWGEVSPITGTSLRSTFVAWVMSSSMALLFNLEQLIDMMSIGTLTAYIVVAVSVVQIRYRPEEERETVNHVKGISFSCAAKAIVNYERVQTASSLTSWIVTAAQIIFLLFSVPVSYLLSQVGDYPASKIRLACIGIIVIFLFLVTLCIALQPSANTEENEKFKFKMPFVPFLPYLSILVNIFLMMKMNWETWTRFSAWLLIGLILYFWYSIRHSLLAQIVQPQSKTSSRFESGNSPEE